MIQAVHLICTPTNTPEGWLYLDHPEKGSPRYRSGFWFFKQDDARSLVGGWLYLHEKKRMLSGFGGKIVGFEVTQFEGGERVVFEVEASRYGRKQKWRGLDHGRAWTGGLVDVDLPHEIEGAK